MAQTALLISEQRVKQWTNLDNNVRVEEITPFIIIAQDTQLQGRIGTAFYNRLKEGVINNDLNASERTLLNDYIGPMLAHYSLYYMLPAIKYKVVDKGILSGTSEETAPTSLDELNYLRQSSLDIAEFYDKRLLEFLCDADSGTYPLYDNPGPDGMAPNTNEPYFSGLVTNINWYEGKTRCNCEGNCECERWEY